jgi:uncharacterized protein YggE
MSLSTTGPAWRRATLPASIALLVSAAAAALVLGGGSSSVAATGDGTQANTVSVSGTGTASGTPDVLRLDIGVQRTGQNVNAALNAANDDIRRIKEALGRHGVADKDIQTSQLSINPHYDPYDGGNSGTVAPAPPMPAPDVPAAPPASVEPPSAPTAESGTAVAPAQSSGSGSDTASGGGSAGAATASVAPESKPMVDVAPAGPAAISPRPGGGINGYDVFQSLTVKLRKLDDAGSAISDAADAGGNATRINGVSFDIEDNGDLLKQARDAAFADAKAKAEQYARLAGRTLGRVSQINEGSVGSGPIMYGTAKAEAAMDSSVPIQPGTQQLSISNTVVWELT